MRRERRFKTRQKNNVLGQMTKEIVSMGKCVYEFETVCDRKLFVPKQQRLDCEIEREQQGMMMCRRQQVGGYGSLCIQGKGFEYMWWEIDCLFV